MLEVPIPVIIGTVMILIGVVLGIYVAIQAIKRNKKGEDSLQ